MTAYLIDSWAWIEYIDGTPRGRKVKETIESGEKIFSAAITVAEVTSKIKRRSKDYVKGRDAIVANSKIIPLEEKEAYAAGQIHAEMRKTNPDIGIADAIIIATARKLNAKILTGDPDFKDVQEAVLI